MSARRAEGPEPAFAQCAGAFEAECEYVYRALRRHGVRPDDAEDLVQEVFLVMWRRWATFDPRRALRPWLAGIAFKVAHAHHRRRSRHEIPTADVELPTNAPGPEDRLAQARAGSLVLAALARVPEAQRSVLVMHDLDGLAVPEIATLVGAPRFTIYTRLRRARLRFQEILQALEGEPRTAEGRRNPAIAAQALLARERQATLAPPGFLARVRVRLLAQPGVPPPVSGAAPPLRTVWLALGALAAGGLIAFVARSSGPVRAPAPVGPAAIAPAIAPGPAPIALRSVTPPAIAATSIAPLVVVAAPIALDAGLVGHWDFDELPGSAVARDGSGRGHDCVLRALDPRTAWRPGHVGNALNLGVHGWLECPQPSVPARAPVAMTVALWMNRVRPHAVTTLVDRYLGPNQEVVVHFALRGNTLQLWSALWGGTTQYELEAPPAGWVHLAFTHGGRTTKIFVDGTLVAQRDDGRPKPSAAVGTAPLVVGAFVKDPTRVWQHLDGAVDELRVYDRALSAGEIEALAAAR